MKNKYTLLGRSSFPVWFIIGILCMIISIKSAYDNNQKITFYLFIPGILIQIFAFIYLWLHPFVEITTDGLKVTRIYFFKRFIIWNNMRLKKKTRKATRPHMLGMDPRYILIVQKDSNWVEKNLFVLPFFKNYDKFVEEIERHLDKNDISKDSDYY